MMRKMIISTIMKIDTGSRYWKNTGWLSTKCPYCDSDSKKRHFNIRFKDNLSMKYKCFRATCGVEGLFTRKIAIDLGITDGDILKYITKESYKSSEDFDKRGYYKNNILYKLPELSIESVEYFKKRTGVILTDYQLFYKSFSSIKKFISMNNIKTNKSLKYLIYKENEGSKFIYFLNNNNTMILYREINGDSKGKIPLVDIEDKIHMPYILKRDKGDYISQDNDNEDRNQLFIAEGIFDIINMYNKFSNQKGTFISSNGFSNISSIIKDFVKFNYKSNVVILSDGDINPYIYKYKHLKIIENRINHLYVLYNEDYNDYGNIEEIKNIKKIILK